MIRNLLSALLVCLLSCHGASAEILLITSSDAPLYQRFSSALMEAPAGSEISPEEIKVHTVETLENGSVLVDVGEYSLLVSAGVEAAKHVAKMPLEDIDVIYSMIPRSSYYWLKENDLLAPRHLVLFVDQPPERYVNLVSKVMPNASSLGYLYGDVSKNYLDEIRHSTAEAKLKFIEGPLSPQRRLPASLKDVFLQSDILMVLPDPYLYNRRSVQGVLLASFRYKRPLVAYSEPFAKAGALVALFSTPEQMGRYSSELARCYLSACKKETSQQFYPKYFSVLVNSAVARQFGLEVKASNELRQLLESIESDPH